jgi:integrase
MIYFATLSGGRWSRVMATRSAVAAYHQAHWLPPPPFADPLLANFWRGLQKSCDNTVGGKDVLPKPTLVALLSGWHALPSLAATRNAFVAAVQFYGMRRISEVLALTRADILPGPAGLGYEILIQRQKNDPFGRGHRVFLPETTTDGLPVGAIVRAFLDRTADLPAPLVRATRGGAWGDTAFTQAAWVAALRSALGAVLPPGTDLRPFASHSLRKGGATAAVQVEMPHDCMVETAGWRGAQTYRSYVRRPAAERQAQVARI